jgi:hypothetical protein
VRIDRFEEVRDCLHRLKIRYRFNRNVQEDFLKQFKEGSSAAVKIYDARHLLPSAKVLYRIEDPEKGYFISGSLDIDYCDVTYYKRQLPQSRDFVENILELIPA